MAISSSFPRALADLGAIYLAAGNVQQALGYLNQAIKHDPNNENALHNLNDAAKLGERVNIEKIGHEKSKPSLNDL